MCRNVKVANSYFGWLLLPSQVSRTDRQIDALVAAYVFWRVSNHARDSLRDKTQVGCRLYQFRSSGLSDVFFNLGRWSARFWFFGNIPSLNDASHILVIDWANCLHNCITSHVGIWSRPRCLAGKFMMILEILTVVTDRNIQRKHWSKPTYWGSTTTGGADSVDWWMLPILSRKPVAKSSAVCWYNGHLVYSTIRFWVADVRGDGIVPVFLYPS